MGLGSSAPCPPPCRTPNPNPHPSPNPKPNPYPYPNPNPNPNANLALRRAALVFGDAAAAARVPVGTGRPIRTRHLPALLTQLVRRRLLGLLRRPGLLRAAPTRLGPLRRRTARRGERSPREGGDEAGADQEERAHALVLGPRTSSGRLRRLRLAGLGGPATLLALCTAALELLELAVRQGLTAVLGSGAAVRRRLLGRLRLGRRSHPRERRGTCTLYYWRGAAVAEGAALQRTTTLHDKLLSSLKIQSLASLAAARATSQPAAAARRSQVRRGALPTDPTQGGGEYSGHSPLVCSAYSQ